LIYEGNESFSNPSSQHLDGEEEEEEEGQQREEIWCHLIVPFTIEDVQAPAVVMKGLP